jgi:hypothetical protein
MAVDTTSHHSRRSLLAGAIGSIVALLAQALGRPATTKGAVEYVKLGGSNITDGSTLISSSSPQASTWKNLGSGHGFLAGSGSNYGLKGASSSDVGVGGSSSYGIAIEGVASGASQTSIHGIKSVGGHAIHGEIADWNSGWTAVYGSTNGPGVGVVGESTGNGHGTWGKAAGSGDGIYGESANGRGGHFKGKKAQLRLDPSTASTHPSSGAAGAIFLDKSKRLWLCKGGTSWVRIV